ncbi:hypothetical protein C8R47DRAFT_987653, partial [Mycena vitilis]
CPGCKKEVPEFRCRDCHGNRLFCKACTVSRHCEHPLHRIYRWNGVYFAKTPLSSPALGLRVQLGHTDFSPCPTPEASKEGFVALHTNGIHEVELDFCGCELANKSGPPEVQLLRAGWFPATHERPHTAATFAVLDQFHQETLQAKVTMYDFYGVLEKLTSNVGVKPPDRYHEWIRVCREYRHLMMLKRGGRLVAYDTSGAAGTKPGELAIECPACPRPGINLPEGWDNAPPEKRFLYTFFLALDACFRLKRRLVSNELRDPGLGTGWAYMLENEEYRKYLRTVTDQKEMNTCSGLAALDYANTKFSRGYATTGVGMGVCARHEFVQPNGVGDLQRGERFANMDYITGSILRHKDGRLRKMVSYDISCIWSLLFKDRMEKLPPLVRLQVILALFDFVIPKMHIHAHTLQCQLKFSLNLTRGSAQTDGEGIERPWASIGGVATSTRDMGPGARHGVLDCQWSYWNWQKLVGIVATLRRRKDRAVAEKAEQQILFDEFSREQSDKVPEWKAKVDAFEENSKNPNPYEIKLTGLSEAKVRLQFTQEEAKQAAEGVPAVHNVSPSKFVSVGLDLEDEQRRVRVQAILKKAGTTGMLIDLTSMRTSLNRRIAQFRKLQATYAPAALLALGEMDLPEDQTIENVPLILPSAMTPAQRKAGCMTGLADIEGLMRDAQCRAALACLRNQLHIKSRLFVYKKNHTRHQGANTRARTIVARNESKIGLHSEKYQMAWDAMRLLREDGDGTKLGFHVLKKEDIRCMEDTEDLARKQKRALAAKGKRTRWAADLLASGLLPSERDDNMDVDEDEEDDVERVPENRRKISWIWTVAGTSGTDAELQDALRIEWSKAYARTHRWDEESRLVEEEYQRVGVSFEHEARRWEARARAVAGAEVPPLEAQGAIAFATRQAEMYRDLRRRGEITWTEEKIPRGKKRVREPIAAGARPVLANDAIQNEAALDEEEERELAVEGIDSDDEDFLFSGAVEDE